MVGTRVRAAIKWENGGTIACEWQYGHVLKNNFKNGRIIRWDDGTEEVCSDMYLEEVKLQ